MEDKVFTVIRDFAMISPGDTVVVGVSGGSDSMALLHFLLINSKKLACSILAAHVNYCLRGSESDRDELCVRGFCRENDVRLECLKVDTKAIAAQRKLGIEECARNIRYDFFTTLCKEEAYKIATAHTLSDNTETVLLNLTRGSALKGLCGIPPVRGNIIRPLILVQKSETESYCLEKNIAYMSDSSNADRSYTRNKIRLDVVPILKSINPALDDCVWRLTQRLGEDSAYLDYVARELFSTEVCQLKLMPLPICSRIIKMYCEKKCGVSLSNKNISLVLNMIHTETGAVEIPRSYRAFIDQGRLCVEREEHQENSHTAWIEEFREGEIRSLNNEKIKVTVINYEEFVNILKADKMLFKNSLDYDTIQKVAFFRNRRMHDVFSPLNRGISKKLKKFFNEMKLPQSTRNEIMLLAMNDEVLWIDGIGVSDKAKVRKGTKRVVIIKKERDDMCAECCG